MKAGKTKAKSWAPAITSVDLENIVAAKGPAELMEAVMTERLEENPVTIVILKQQVNAF